MSLYFLFHKTDTPFHKKSVRFDPKDEMEIQNPKSKFAKLFSALITVGSL